jgi:hypothetical protein
MELQQRISPPEKIELMDLLAEALKRRWTNTIPFLPVHIDAIHPFLN